MMPIYTCARCEASGESEKEFVLGGDEIICVACSEAEQERMEEVEAQARAAAEAEGSKP